MLHLIPKPLHRFGYRLAHALRRVWWRLARPNVTGCRVLALDEEGRVLLVRHSYGKGTWMPPGGGLRRGEDPLRAGARELREETGCVLAGGWQVEQVAVLVNGATNRVHVIAGAAVGIAVPDGREIVEAAFFATDALPQPMSETMRRDLPGWLRVAKAGRPADLPGCPSPAPSPRV
jgi:8-oxo-dGTP pyrophosphatase MutT (NUDIX family)